MPVIEEILMNDEENLAKYLGYGLRKICDYFSIAPSWQFSSNIKKDGELSGQDKIIAMCKQLDANSYINLPGGRELYSRERFQAIGIELLFIEPHQIQYRQFDGDFVPNFVRRQNISE